MLESAFMWRHLQGTGWPNKSNGPGWSRHSSTLQRGFRPQVRCCITGPLRSLRFCGFYFSVIENSPSIISLGLGCQNLDRNTAHIISTSKHSEELIQLVGKSQRDTLCISTSSYFMILTLGDGCCSLAEELWVNGRRRGGCWGGRLEHVTLSMMSLLPRMSAL